MARPCLLIDTTLRGSQYFHLPENIYIYPGKDGTLRTIELSPKKREQKLVLNYAEKARPLKNYQN
jgi:hypothetical protein